MRGRILAFTAGSLACVVTPVGPLYASNGLAIPTYQLLTTLHIFGAILFLGSIVASGLWMSGARKTNNRAVLHFASRAVVRADWFYALPGLILIIGPGVMGVGRFGGFGRASWAELSLALTVLVVVIWLTQLVRYQRMMLQITREAVELRIGLSDEFHKYAARWSFWGGVVILLLLGSLVLMVFKPHLWGPLA
ncbi:MAG: DUF2269 family protein [Candidatus Latescibacterota bacterium]|nr:MAG: DUF2269 family protein [Candidatus Latescibacterota bacterium]